jgi:hypothetical protein
MQAVRVCADTTPRMTRRLAAGAPRRIPQPCHSSHVRVGILYKKSADSAAQREAVELNVQDSCACSAATARTDTYSTGVP